MGLKAGWGVHGQTVTFDLGFIHLVVGKSNVLPLNDVTLISAAFIEFRESLVEHQG